MKTYFCLIFMTIFFCIACNDDTNPIEIIDFSGIYVGTFNCNGDLAEANESNFTIIIEKKVSSGTEYLIFMEDDVNFTAKQEDNVLNLPTQTFNETEDFDRITMSGQFRKLENENLSYDFTHRVDEGEESDCTTILLKQ